MTKQIQEGLENALTKKGKLLEITLITPGWGSSGYYSAAILEQAAKDRVFPRLTQQHIDHEKDGGVGSVSTLAAYLNEDARWEPDWLDPKTGVKGRLVAESRVSPKWQDDLAFLAEALGTSIAAPAEIGMGEAEGRQGRIIEKLLPGPLNRVDFVTVAGRGGRISEVLESAKVEEARNVGMWLEARMHSMFTSISDDMFGDGRLTRPERITLSAALGQALTSFTATVEAEAPQLFERDLWEDPTPAAEESAAASSSPNPAEVNEGKEPIVGQIQIEESVHATLVADASRATVLEGEKSTALEALKSTNDDSAAALVASAFESAGVTAPKTAARLSAGYPVKENGALNVEQFKQDIAEAVAEFQVANGAGTPRGVGDVQEQTKVTMTKEDAEAKILKIAGFAPKGA